MPFVFTQIVVLGVGASAANRYGTAAGVVAAAVTLGLGALALWAWVMLGELTDRDK